MYCRNCGSLVSDDAKFCMRCGANLDNGYAQNYNRDDMPVRAIGFGEAIESYFKNYVNFSGRATRSEYWYAYLFNLIIGLVLSAFQTGFSLSGNNTLYNTFAVVSVIYSLAVFLPSLSVAVRRFHDAGKSGWLYFALAVLCLISYIVFIACAVVMFLKATFGGTLLFLFIVFAIAAVVFALMPIYYFCKKSDKDNKYGPRKI